MPVLEVVALVVSVASAGVAVWALLVSKKQQARANQLTEQANTIAAQQLDIQAAQLELQAGLVFKDEVAALIDKLRAHGRTKQAAKVARLLLRWRQDDKASMEPDVLARLEKEIQLAAGGKVWMDWMKSKDR